MVDPSSLESDAKEFIKQAEHYEEVGNYEIAIFYYVEGVQAWLNAKSAGSTNPDIMKNAHFYTKKAEKLAKKKSNFYLNLDIFRRYHSTSFRANSQKRTISIYFFNI